MATQGISFRIFARDDASKTFSKVTREAEKSSRTMGRVGAASHGLFASIRTSALAAAAGIGVFGGGALLAGFISEARESTRAAAQTAAVLKSTGGAAGITAGQIGDLANRLSGLSAVDDELIQQSSNMLLTFRSVRNEAGKGNDVFNQAQQAILDMSAAYTHGNVTAEDLRARTIQVGKALQDPIKGVTALRRVGVQLDDQQTKSIKTFMAQGNVMAAQKIILGELNKEFGGSAKAMADPLQRLQVTVKNLQEKIGLALLPALNSLANWMSNTAPGVVNKTMAVFGALFGFIKANSGWLLPLVGGIAAFAATVKTVLVLQRAWIATQAAWAAVTKAGTAAQWALNIAMSANPVGLVIAAIVGLIAVLVIAYKRSETFRRIVQAAFGFVLRAAQATWTWIRRNWPVLLGALAGPVGIATVRIIQNWGKIKAGAINAVHTVVGWFGRLPGMISRAVGNFGGLLYGRGRAVISGLFSGMLSIWRSVTRWISGLGGWIRSHKGPPSLDARLLTPAGRLIMKSLWDGLKAGAGPIGKWLQNFTASLGGGPANVTGAVAIGRAMAAQRGWVGNQWAALYQLWQGESGWNPRARNPSSGAFGIPQALPPGKMGAAAVAGDAAAQIAWGLSYIAGRYGTPAAALSAWMRRSPHWYDQGGYLMPGLTAAINQTGRRERILTPAETAAYESGGSVVVNVHVTGSVVAEKDLARTVRDVMSDIQRKNGRPVTVR